MIFIKKLLIYLIRAYQITPLHSHSMCRFTPTCSEYMIEALNEYGLFKGLWVGLKRLFRCRPFGKFGIDKLKKEGQL